MATEDPREPTTPEELNTLAETLRASIASLDEHTERHARAIAAELVATGAPELYSPRPQQIGHLLYESMEMLQRAGELMREEFFEQAPEAAHALRNLPDEIWTATAFRWAVDLHPAGASIAADLRTAAGVRAEKRDA